MVSPTVACVLITAALAAPAPPTARVHPPKPMRMTATAFCERGPTKLGVQAQRGVAAADPRFLPLGSTVRVDGLGGRAQTFVVTDTGSAVKGRHIDLFIPSCAAAKRFGRKPVIVRTLKMGDPATR